MRLAIGLFLSLILSCPALAFQLPPDEINITTDSKPGWLPTNNQRADAVKAMRAFNAAKEAGEYEAAYNYLADSNKQHQPLSDFVSMTQHLHNDVGSQTSIEILKITWTKDPAASPVPGVYVAIDIAARFEKADRFCGYLVMYQAPTGGPFRVMREQSTFISNASIEEFRKSKTATEVDAIWANAARTCPNYMAPPR